jgi:hypothetical protein
MAGYNDVYAAHDLDIHMLVDDTDDTNSPRPAAACGEAGNPARHPGGD